MRTIKRKKKSISRLRKIQTSMLYLFVFLFSLNFLFTVIGCFLNNAHLLIFVAALTVIELLTFNISYEKIERRVVKLKQLLAQQKEYLSALYDNEEGGENT